MRHAHARATRRLMLVAFPTVVAALLSGIPAVAHAASVDGALLTLEEAGLSVRAPNGNWGHVTSSTGPLLFRCDAGGAQWAGVGIARRATPLASADDALAALEDVYQNLKDTFHARHNDQGPEPRRLAGVEGWYHAWHYAPLKPGQMETQVRAEIHAWVGWRGGYVVVLVCGSPTSVPEFNTGFYNSVAGSMRSDGTWQAAADPAGVPAPKLVGSAPAAPDVAPSLPGMPAPSAPVRAGDEPPADGDSGDGAGGSGGGNTMLMVVVAVVLLGGVAVVVAMSGSKGNKGARSGGRGAPSRGRGAPRAGGGGGNRGPANRPRRKR